MKSIYLLNPMRKFRSRRRIRRKASSLFRSNPVRRRRRKRTKRTTSYVAPRRKSTRRRRRSTTRRTTRTRTVFVAAKRSTRRRTRRSSVARRSTRRSFRRRSRSISVRGFGLGALTDKSNLKIGLGVVASTFLTSEVMQRFGAVKNNNGTLVVDKSGFTLPGSDSAIGIIAWNIAIPLLGAAVAKKVNQPELAKGMIISSIVTGLNSAIAYARANFAPGAGGQAALKPTGEYFQQALPAPQVEAVEGIFDSEPAFADAF